MSQRRDVVKVRLVTALALHNAAASNQVIVLPSCNTSETNVAFVCLPMQYQSVTLVIIHSAAVACVDSRAFRSDGQFVVCCKVLNALA